MRITSLHLICLLLAISGLLPAQNLNLVETFSYQSGSVGHGGMLASSYDFRSRRLFVANAGENFIDIIALRDFTKAARIGRINLDPYGERPIDVLVDRSNLIVLMENSFAQGQGRLVFFDTLGSYINQFFVGASPSDLHLSKNSNYLLVANEGRPSDDYNSDPAGSLSLIFFNSGDPSRLNQSDVISIPFTRYDTSAYPAGVRIFGNNGQAGFSQDVEPQAITSNDAETLAYVSLQENNALAIIDLPGARLDTVLPLGLKNFGAANQGLDASDSGKAINISSYDNLYGMYQPGGLVAFAQNGQEYLLSANQGAPRRYSAYDEVRLVKNVPLSVQFFPGASQLVRDSILGRLQITNTLGNRRMPPVYDSLVAFGTRSISLWDLNGNLLWDSDDQIEQSLATLHAANFNASDTSNRFKNTSPASGAEPKTLAYGLVDSIPYAFVGLRQMGGFMVYNLSNPGTPVFDSYILNRDFSAPANDTAAGDLGTEDLHFVKAQDSPNGIALLVATHSRTGSITVYQMGQGIGLREYILDAPLQIYPNPSRGIIYQDQERELHIFNSSGQEVRRVKNQLEIDLTELPEGYYHIRDTEGRSLKILRKN